MKKTSTSKGRINHKHKGLTLVVIGLLALASLSYYAFSWTGRALKVQANQAAISQRRDRITAIYDSLHMGSDYVVTSSDIFGQKMLYPYDKSRSYSSARTYIHNANVDVTAKEVQLKIEEAGFMLFEEPYPGSTFTELHFRNPQGEFVRMNVSSQPRNDDFRLHQDSSIDPNQGPSEVIVKVNLDDNNE